MNRIGVKLFIGFLLMAVLTVLVLWVVQAGIMRDSYIDEYVGRIDQTLTQSAHGDAIDFESLEESLGAHFVWVDAQGNVAYMSQRMPMRGMVLHALQTQDWPQGRSGLYTLEASSMDARYAMFRHTLDENGSLFAVISLTNVEEASRILRRQLWIVTFVLVGLSVALAVVLSRRFSRPIRDVTGAARALAAGKLDVRLRVPSGDEIGQLTEALNDLGEQLQATERLRRELIANVSHELRAPLSVIRGYAETVRDVTWPHEDKRVEQLSLIADEAARLNRIVSDMLDYSRLQSGAAKLMLEDFPLREALETAASRHALDAQVKGVALRVQCPDARVCFDGHMFSRVMDNLLSNAVRHALPDSEISIRAERMGGAMRIHVQNQGIRIAREDLDKIWDRYYRAGADNEDRRTGSGLGLAIVRSIMDLHSASYGVQSDEKGTVFWFDAALAAS